MRLIAVGAFQGNKRITTSRGWIIACTLAVFAMMVAATLWRFRQWMPDVLYGDDLDYFLLFLNGQCATRAHEILSTACYERFRPVASGWVVAMMNLFGNRIDFHMAGNVLIQGLIGTVSFAIAYRLTGRSLPVSLLVALAIVTSRFATYLLTQVIGPVESLTLLLVLSTVYAAIRADSGPSSAWRWAWAALACVFLAAHSHERSLVVAVWLAMVFLASPSVRALGARRMAVLLAACLSIPIYYVAFKTFVLDAYFLVGTGGTHLDLGMPMVAEHGLSAMRSLLGFNTGPDYLVGTSVTAAMPWAWVLAIAFSLSWVFLLAISIRDVVVPGAAVSDPGMPALIRMRWPLLLLALAAGMLLPALLTIRLEQRWLLAPFCLGLLAAACSMESSIATRRIRSALVALLCVSSILLDGVIMAHYDRIYFVSSSRLAADVKRDIVDGYPQRQDGVALLASANDCLWTLRSGGFFRVYGGQVRPVHCFSSLEEATASGLGDGTHLYVRGAENRFQDYRADAGKLAARSNERKRYDFLESFEQGRIDDERVVSTPTGRGVLLMPWDSSSGVQRTVTLLSGFSYRYDGIPMAAGDELRFSVAMVYPTPDPARLVVRLLSQGAPPRILYSEDIPPPATEAPRTFLEVQVPLGPAGEPGAALEFSVQSPGGDNRGHWVALAEPRLVRAGDE